MSISVFLFAATVASAAPLPSASTSATMQNCPTSVPGTATAVKDVSGGVELTVTGKGEAVGHIRMRAKALVHASKSVVPETKHDSRGDGGGLSGRCPVVMFKSAVTSADVDGGATITVKADNAAQVDWLRQETRERIGEGALIGTGRGKMAHCPSALAGAITKVTDNKDGVVVVITGKGDVAKAIRARAADLVAAAALPEGAVGHTGDGQGGGGLGRCPVVVKDTTLALKDVEGGSQITVAAKTPAGASVLQKEAHERAARLPAPP